MGPKVNDELARRAAACRVSRMSRMRMIPVPGATLSIRPSTGASTRRRSLSWGAKYDAPRPLYTGCSEAEVSGADC